MNVLITGACGFIGSHLVEHLLKRGARVRGLGALAVVELEESATDRESGYLDARGPRLAQEFERRLHEDAAFAGSPAARLEFFHRRHPSWDERYGLYPVYRQ